YRSEPPDYHKFIACAPDLDIGCHSGTANCSEESTIGAPFRRVNELIRAWNAPVTSPISWRAQQGGRHCHGRLLPGRISIDMLAFSDTFAGCRAAYALASSPCRAIPRGPL